MGRQSILAMLFAAWLAACAPAPSTDSAPPTPRFEPVAEDASFPVSPPAAFDSLRGWLVVAENRADPDSREIRLPVAIVRRGEADPDAAPVLYLAGGPGVSALSAAAYPGAYPWTADRDFIVLGQRGTHDARPALMCPELREAAESGEDRVAAIAACRDRLGAEGVDLTAYHSDASADDIEDLRRVLGIERWSLYGVSYGTRLALAVARRHPGGVAALLLDSPLPPNAIYDDESARNFESRLRAVARDCAGQAACATAFPGLEQRFFERLAAGAAAIEGAPGPIQAAELAGLVSLDRASGIRRAPLVMDAVARLDPALAPLLTGPGGLTDFAWGMRLSVWCSEAWPFSRRAEAPEPGPVLGGFESAAVDPAWCEAWNAPPRPAGATDAVSAAMPALILAGEFDPLTPPAFAELAAATLENSRVVIVRGEGHSPTQQWDGDGCAMQMAAAFIADPERVLEAGEGEFCVFARPAPDYLTEAP